MLSLAYFGFLNISPLVCLVGHQVLIGQIKKVPNFCNTGYFEFWTLHSIYLFDQFLTYGQSSKFSFWQMVHKVHLQHEGPMLWVQCYWWFVGDTLDNLKAFKNFWQLTALWKLFSLFLLGLVDKMCVFIMKGQRFNVNWWFVENTLEHIRAHYKLFYGWCFYDKIDVSQILHFCLRFGCNLKVL